MPYIDPLDRPYSRPRRPVVGQGDPLDQPYIRRVAPPEPVEEAPRVNKPHTFLRDATESVVGGVMDTGQMLMHPIDTAAGMAAGIVGDAYHMFAPGSGSGENPTNDPELAEALKAQRSQTRKEAMLNTALNVGTMFIPGSLMAKGLVRGAVGAGLGAHYAPTDERTGKKDRIRGATIGATLGEVIHQTGSGLKYAKAKIRPEAPKVADTPARPFASLSHEELVDAITEAHRPTEPGTIIQPDAKMRQALQAEFEHRFPKETVTPLESAPDAGAPLEPPGRWQPPAEPVVDPFADIPEITPANRAERRAGVEQGLNESSIEQMARNLREARRLRAEAPPAPVAPTPVAPTPDTRLFAPLPPEAPRQLAKPWPTLGPPSAKVEPQPIPEDVLAALGSKVNPPEPQQMVRNDPVLGSTVTPPTGIEGAARRLRLERSTPVEPQAPVAPPEELRGTLEAQPISGAVGKPAKVLMRDGQALPAQYRVVEAADLQPSHDPFTFLPNDRYPNGVQGRDYQRNGGAQEAVKHRTMNYSPDIALDPSEMAASGVPTILPDGTVLAGNERVMLAKRVVEQNPTAAADYRQQIMARAEQHGVPPEAIAGMQHPVLVRELTAPKDVAGGPKRWQEINRLSDESATKEKSSLESGSARAQKLANASESLRHLTNTMAPEQTIADYAGTADGRTFARKLVQDGVITPEEFGRLSEADGTLKPEGRQAVRDMLLSTAITDPTTLADSPSAVKNKLEHAIPSIVALKGTEFDISPVVTDAMKALTRARDLNVTLQDLAAQTSLLGDEVHHSPAALHLAQVLDEGKVGEIKAMFRNYAREALGAKGGEIGMFGDQTGHETPTDVFNKNFGGTVKELPGAEPIRQAAMPEPEGDTFRASAGGGKPTPIDPTQHGLFSPEETPTVGRGGQLGFGLDDELPLAVEDRGPKGLTEATAKAEKVLADQREQMMAKAGKPSPEYRDALAWMNRGEKISAAETGVRGADALRGPDTFRTNAGGGGPTKIRPERAPEEPVGSTFDADVYEEPAPISNLPTAPGMDRGSRSGKETLAGAAETIVRTLNPEWMGEFARGTAGTIRSTNANRQEIHAQAQFALREAARKVGRLDRPTQVQLHDALDNWSKKGAREFVAKIDPELPFLLDEFKRLTQKYADALTERGILEQTMEDYVGRFFTHPTKTIAQVVGSIFGKRPMQGSMSFAKERSIVNFKDAVTPKEQGGRGLTPATYNFVEAQLYKFAEMGKAIAVHDALQMEVAGGRATKVFTAMGEKPAEGWRIGDRNDPKLTIYGPNKVSVGEYGDTGVDAALAEVVKSLPGLTHERKLKIGGRRLGYAEGPSGKRMVTKFGTYAGVAMHELGHIIGFRYKLFEQLTDPPGNYEAVVKTGPNAGKVVKRTNKQTADRIARRKVINDELRALAKERGLPAEQSSYVNNRYEKEANAIHALIYAPELMERVAPNVKAKLTEILQSDPRLAKVLEIKPTLKVGKTGSTEVEIAGRPILGYYAFPEGSAQVWDNYLSRGFKGNPVYDMLQLPMQSATQLILGVSGFHGVVITFEQIFSEMALGMERGGLKGMVKATPGAFASPVKSYKIGNAIMEEYRNPGSHPEYRPTIEYMKKGGWGVGGESDLGRKQGYGWADGERVSAFKRAFDDALHGSTPTERAIGAAKVVPDAIMAGIEIAAHPVLGKYVPAQKAFATYRAVAMEVEKLGPHATADQVNKVMADVTKQMDYRFGQVMYHNHFMNNAVKHITQLLVMAPGWTFGTVALAGHGFGDVARMGKEFKASGYKKAPAIPRSAAYWVSSIVATAFVNGVVTYLMTGQMPTGKDFLAFRDGTKDGDGNDNRHTIPGYLMHDIYGWSHHPIKTMKNKLSPGVHWAAAVASNEDFWGNKVYDDNADWPTQLKQLSEYTLESVKPISVSNWQEGRRRGEVGVGGMLMNAGGINPAPREFQRTKAQNTLARLSSGKGGGLAPDEADRQQRMQQARKAYRMGDRAPFQKLIASGEATRRDLVAEIKSVRKNPSKFVDSFSHQSLANAEKVYADASPSEKQKLLRILLDKRRRARQTRTTIPQEP